MTTATATTLSRLLDTLGAVLRVSVPAATPAFAGAPAVALTETRAQTKFGGDKPAEEYEPAWASFPRAL
ncbi:hypothetical protein GCM10007301_26550 [Azorhizobium oxalatiphilum]|uniref:Uncharacterized protein n=1 Tax=Azorhizobium oxalatiphilum TaxID=980631 RepID=A0A917FDP7_9HYPH|nr:hypothetical protein [Azorhizobium oxalatiphilum]GGF65481.1 hypothetical protein GCM10007301_26550 [Azorhizobium oxalatiphilum]